MATRDPKDLEIPTELWREGMSPARLPPKPLVWGWRQEVELREYLERNGLLR